MKYIISLVAIAITGWLSAQHNIVLFYSTNGVQHTDTVLYSTTQTHFDDVYIQPGSTFSIDSVVVNTEISQNTPVAYYIKNIANNYILYDIDDLTTVDDTVYNLKIGLINHNREYYFVLNVTHLASVNELSKNELKVYPNPVKDILYVGGPVEIYSTYGKVILTSNESEIDMSEFDSGIYFMKTQSAVVKIIKE